MVSSNVQQGARTHVFVCDLCCIVRNGLSRNTGKYRVDLHNDIISLTPLEATFLCLIVGQLRC